MTSSGKKWIGIALVLLVILAVLLWVFLQNRGESSKNANAVPLPQNTNVAPNGNQPANANAVSNTNAPANVNRPANTNTAQANTNAAPANANTTRKKSLKDYDRTVITYESTNETVTGTGGVTYDAYDKKLDVVYNFYFTETLERSSATTYPYAGRVSDAENVLTIPPSLLSTRYCKLDEVSDPFGRFFHDSYRCGKTGDTDRFFITFDGSFDSYAEVLAVDTLLLYRDEADTFADPAAIVADGTLAKQYVLKQTKIEIAE